MWTKMPRRISEILDTNRFVRSVSGRRRCHHALRRMARCICRSASRLATAARLS